MRIGQRVAGNGLKARADNGQSRAHHHGQQRAGKADVLHNSLASFAPSLLDKIR